MTYIKDWKPSKFVSGDVAKAAIANIAPQWLLKLNHELINDARKFGSGMFNSMTGEKICRHHGAAFYGVTRGLDSRITITGQKVQHTAFDDSFRVPVGGFSAWDFNPVTKQIFEGGQGKKGSYVILDDKPQSEGEAPKAVSRTYTKYSGQTIKTKGFMDESIRYNIGWGIFLSPKGKDNFNKLAMMLGVDIAEKIVDQVTIEGVKLGFTVTAGELRAYEENTL
jgi:hypothetical protein